MKNKKYISTNRYVTNHFLDSPYLLPKDSVCFTSIASIGKICKTKQPSITNQQINSIICSKQFNSDYIYYYMRYLTPKIKSTVRTEGMAIINKKDFSLIQIKKIPLIEQQKIAKFLSLIDILITKQEECLNTIIKKKDYYYGNIINSGVKFKNIDGKWTSRKIGDIFYNYNGVSLESEVSNEGKYKFISIGNYSSNGKYLDDNKRVLKNKKTSSKILNKDNLVMVLNDKTSNGIIIGSTILIEDDDKYIYNQRSEKLICKNEITPLFAWYFLNSKKVKNNIISLAQGATQIYFNFSSFKKSSFFIPKKEEQTKITNLLSSMDNLINMLVLIY